MDQSRGSRSEYDSNRSYGSGGQRAHNMRGGGFRENFRKSEASAPREPSQVQIFIEGLPLNVRIPELVDYFSTVGKIKIDRESNKPRVWLYHDKRTGDPTGEATITYHDHETQKRALERFNGQRFMERYELTVTPSIVKVHMAKPPPLSVMGQRGRGGRGNIRGGSYRGGGFRGGGGYRRGDGNRERGRQFVSTDRNSSMSINERRRNDHSSYGFQSRGDIHRSHEHRRNY